MIIQRAYKFQLRTDDRQAGHLAQFAGCCRLVWNKALAIQKEQFSRGERILRYKKTCAELPRWKHEQPFLADVHSQPLQQSLKDLDRAWQDAFESLKEKDGKQKKGFPNFKKKGKRDSFRFPQGVKLDGDKIYLPKIGWHRFRKSRDIEGTVKNVTVSKTLDKWYVSIQTELEVSEPVHASTSAVGIDLGIVNFATVSDGTIIAPINIFKKLEPKLAIEQRKLARKTKYSNNWKKQKKKIQKLHHRIANIRLDFHHKATTKITKNHGIITLEALQVQNMTKSAKGTVDKPGINVAAKSGLNKSITDQGWSEFRRQISYKQQWLGGKVVLVNPMNTSRTCFKCKYVAAENRKTQALFRCVRCGHCDHADINAAKNILAAGHAVLACGEIGQDAA